MNLVCLLAFLIVIFFTVDGAPVASNLETADGEQEASFGELIFEDIEHLQHTDLVGDPCGDGMMSGPCLAIPWRPGSVIIRRPPQPPRRPRPGIITIG